jgi:signal transduction histidine kinase
VSFRLRLIVAFVLVSLLQAGLFTALSDQLLRDGIDGEAAARLELIARLLPVDAPLRDWPSHPVPPQQRQAWRDALGEFTAYYGLARASLLLPGQALDSGSPAPALLGVEDWAASDGMQLPQGRGELRVSGPLFKAADGWRKVLYARLDDDGGAWLRLEAGSPFLGQVGALQRRLVRLSAALALPALALGLALGWLLSRRARALEARLADPEQGVLLGGRDEFARISQRVQALLDSLALQRERADSLSQARLRQAHDLSRGVAHELRNPLASLSLLTDVLLRRRREGAPPQELDELAARLQGEVGRLENTVARFMDFARQPELAPQALDMRALLRDACTGLEPGPAVDGEAKAWADRQATLLVLGVLLTNAAEAAGPQGRVRVQLRQGEGRALVEVWDSGPALSAEQVGKVFTPFFTTKPKGLGLGLATAASLADHMGGRVSLAPDRKTFSFDLPWMDAGSRGGRHQDP